MDIAGTWVVAQSTVAVGEMFSVGIIGGGDIHDGRPGDDLHRFLGHQEALLLSRQGIMAMWAEDLTREAVFAALWNRRGEPHTKRPDLIPHPTA